MEQVVAERIKKDKDWALTEQYMRAEGFDVNKLVVAYHGVEWPLIYHACHFLHLAALQELLLHGELDVNASYRGNTPFLHASQNEKNGECLALLVADPRTDVHATCNEGNVFQNLFDHSVFLYSIKPIYFMFASFNRWSPSEIADGIKGRRKYPAAYDIFMEIMLQYADDPWPVIQKCRAEVGWKINTAAEYFILVVLYTDKYFELKAPPNQFFSVTSRLPMELQMIICNWIAGLNKTNIPTALINNCLKIMIHNNKSLS